VRSAPSLSSDNLQANQSQHSMLGVTYSPKGVRGEEMVQKGAMYTSERSLDILEDSSILFIQGHTILFSLLFDVRL